MSGRPPLRDRTALERAISDEVYDLIVRRYAQTGRIESCPTAVLLFIGPKEPTAEQRKFGTKRPGKFPDWLIAEAKAARAEFLANPPQYEWTGVA